MTQKCKDCGVSLREFHIIGCDKEICPICGEQMWMGGYDGSGVYTGCNCEYIQEMRNIIKGMLVELGFGDMLGNRDDYSIFTASVAYSGVLRYPNKIDENKVQGINSIMNTIKSTFKKCDDILKKYSIERQPYGEGIRDGIGFKQLDSSKSSKIYNDLLGIKRMMKALNEEQMKEILIRVKTIEIFLRSYKEIPRIEKLMDEIRTYWVSKD